MYVDHTAKLSGGEIALSRLLPALTPDVDPFVVLGEDGPLVERLRSIGIPVEVLPLGPATRDVRKDTLTNPWAAGRRVFSVLTYSWRLRRRVRQTGVDVVHTNSLKAGFYGCLAARLAGVPSVWHLRDRLAPDYLPRFALLAARVGLRLLPTRVVCNSRATMATVPSGLRRSWGKRALVVPSPIHDVLHPSTGSDASTGVRGAARDRPFSVGLVGRFAPWKGQLEAVRAFAVDDMTPDARLLLIGAPMFGEEDYEDEVRREVTRLGLDGRVEFVGFVDDVLSRIAELDVLVHASTVPEPFGQVIVEGMAAGVPVVATRGGGPSEIVTDGVNGLLYTAGDVEELADILRRLQEDGDLRASLREAGLRRAADFSPEVIAPTVLALYREMTADPRGRSV